ncbi:unnamed protein product, partial [Ectocarpus sp. 12 AP-2014]
ASRASTTEARSVVRSGVASAEVDDAALLVPRTVLALSLAAQQRCTIAADTVTTPTRPRVSL